LECGSDADDRVDDACAFAWTEFMRYY